MHVVRLWWGGCVCVFYAFDSVVTYRFSASTLRRWEGLVSIEPKVLETKKILKILLLGTKYFIQCRTKHVLICKENKPCRAWFTDPADSSKAVMVLARVPRSSLDSVLLVGFRHRWHFNPILSCYPSACYCVCVFWTFGPARKPSQAWAGAEELLPCFSFSGSHLFC